MRVCTMNILGVMHRKALSLISFSICVHLSLFQNARVYVLGQEAAGNYALDYQNASHLSLVEIKISRELTKALINLKIEDESQRQCYRQLEKYLEDFRRDAAVLQKHKTSSENQDDVYLAKYAPDNPLLLYRLIRRIFVTLLQKVMRQCENVNTITGIIKNAFFERLPFPTEDDLKDAMMGMLRIHFVYGFNASSQLRFGIFGNIRTNVKLTFEDCVSLGVYAVELGAEVLAYQWLTAANLCFIEDIKDDPNQEVASELLHQAWEKLSILANIHGQDMAEMHKMFMGKHEERLASMFLDFEGHATCRGQSFLTEEETSSLYCYSSYMDNPDQDPYFYIMPPKIEVVNFQPPIVVIYDFVGEKMMQYIQDTAFTKTDFARSSVSSFTTDESQVSSVRTSLSTFVEDIKNQNIKNRMFPLNKKIELVTGLHVLKKSSAEALQVVKYSSLGAHYDFHDDAVNALQNEIITHQDGDRIATFFMFLSDVAMGGYTAFPKLGVFVKPVKGSALVWPSLLRNGETDFRTTHGGCPIIMGSKIAANKWIRQYENMWNYPCLLNPDE